jgi:hypothetical protein
VFICKVQIFSFHIINEEIKKRGIKEKKKKNVEYLLSKNIDNDEKKKK